MEKITLQNWLANRQRRYADGVALFRSLAPEEMKSKYLSFFSEVADAPQFDNHYTVLVNKLTSITRMAGARPQTMATAVAVAKAADAKANEVLGDKVLKEILVKETELFALQDKITALEDDNEDKSEEIAALESDLEEAQEELQELQDRLAVLRPGAKIVTYTSLPDNIRLIFDRVRYITPLYASLFTEMQNESLTPEQRAPIANQVHDLWIERAGLWDQIDAWAEGKHVALKLQEKRTEDLPTDPVLKGMQIANRIERLKENIRRTEVSIANHDKNGKMNLKQKAEQRLNAYQKELAELEGMK